MQVDLDFYKNKIRMTDTVRAVSFFTAVDSVESEQAIGQFMTEEPLETTILRTEREITGMNVRFTRYKEWSARWARKKAVTEALDERFQEATMAAGLPDATDEAKELPNALRKEMVALY